MEYGVLVPLLAALGLIGLHELGGGDEKDSVEPEPQPEPEQVQDGTGSVLDGTAGDDSLVLSDPDGGLIDAGTGSDHVVVDTGAPPPGLVEVMEYDEDYGIPSGYVIQPDPDAGTWTDGEGNEWAVGATRVSLDGGDRLDVRSGFVDVDSENGGSEIDLAGASYANISSFGHTDGEPGDTIIGAGADSFVRGYIGQSSHYTGGDGIDDIRSGGASTVIGGAGDDSLVSAFNDAADSLSGGDGNDTLVGSPNGMADSPSQQDLFSYRVDTANDTLDGGAGDDRIIAAVGDVVTTGEGDDRLEAWVEGSEAVVVTDLDPAHDTAYLIVEGPGVGAPDELDMNVFAQRLALVEQDGDTIVKVDGETVAVFRGLTGLTDADVTLSDGEASYDLSGQPIPQADTAIVIEQFNSLWT